MALPEHDLSQLVPYVGDLGADERLAISDRALPEETGGVWVTLRTARGITDNTVHEQQLRVDYDVSRNLHTGNEDLHGF